MATSGVVLAAGLFTGRWTRRSAKEANAGQLYSQVTTMQSGELKRLSDRLEAVEKDRDATKQQNREHMRWDWVMVRRLRIALPDEEFPDPPPLDT
jgi:aryl-alcohol dehydrogenase-like predicted oxidoreductase